MQISSSCANVCKYVCPPQVTVSNQSAVGGELCLKRLTAVFLDSNTGGCFSFFLPCSHDQCCSAHLSALLSEGKTMCRSHILLSRLTVKTEERKRCEDLCLWLADWPIINGDNHWLVWIRTLVLCALCCPQIHLSFLIHPTPFCVCVFVFFAGTSHLVCASILRIDGTPVFFFLEQNHTLRLFINSFCGTFHEVTRLSWFKLHLKEKKKCPASVLQLDLLSESLNECGRYRLTHS